MSNDHSRRWGRPSGGAVVRAVVTAVGLGLLVYLLLVAVGLNRADMLGSVISAVFAIAQFGQTLYRDMAGRAVPGREAEDEAFRRLATAVRKQWDDEAATRELWSPQPIRVRWSVTRRPVQASAAAIQAEDVGESGEGEDLALVVRLLPARQLVVIGRPGSGKTALAMRLVVNLLKHPEPGDPVPVLLSMSSWDPELSLEAWMVERLVEDYPFLRNGAVAERLIEDGRIMPVLDGLDEMHPALMPRAIKLIDQAVGGDRPLVVTCRSTDFEDAVERSNRFFRRALVVELKRVVVKDAVAFLERMPRQGDDRWTAVIAHLREHPDGALAEALATPLMVDLLRDVYADPGTDPAELFTDERFAERAAIEEHLLDRFIPAVYSEFHPDRRYDADQARKWLTFLARELRWEGTRDLALWRLRSDGVTVIVGLLSGFAGWLLGDILFGMWSGIAAGLIIGISGAAAAEYKWSEIAMDERRATDQRSLLRRNLGVSALFTTLVGLLVGGAIGAFLLGLNLNPARFYPYVITWTVIFGLCAGLSTAGGSNLLSRALFALGGNLPLGLKPFVDHAHERGVLRRMGVVYQFRHARLQDHLSGADPETESEPEPDEDDETAPRGRSTGWWLSPMTRLGGQAAVAAVTLIILAAINSTTWINPVGGTKPEVETAENTNCDPTNQSGCNQSEIYVWTVQPRSSVTTEFSAGKADSGRPVTDFAGSIGTGGCSGAAVSVTLTLPGHRPVTEPLAGKGLPSFGEVRSEIKGRFTLTFTRTDQQACALRLRWTGPALLRDSLYKLKQRFGAEDDDR